MNPLPTAPPLSPGHDGQFSSQQFQQSYPQHQHHYAVQPQGQMPPQGQQFVQQPFSAVSSFRSAPGFHQQHQQYPQNVMPSGSINSMAQNYSQFPAAQAPLQQPFHPIAATSQQPYATHHAHPLQTQGSSYYIQHQQIAYPQPQHVPLPQQMSFSAAAVSAQPQQTQASFYASKSSNNLNAIASSTSAPAACKQQRPSASCGDLTLLFLKRMVIYVLSTHTLFSIFARETCWKRLRLRAKIRRAKKQEEERAEELQKQLQTQLKQTHDSFGTLRRIAFFILYVVSIICCNLIVRTIFDVFGQTCTQLTMMRNDCLDAADSFVALSETQRPMLYQDIYKSSLSSYFSMLSPPDTLSNLRKDYCRLSNLNVDLRIDTRNDAEAAYFPRNQTYHWTRNSWDYGTYSQWFVYRNSWVYFNGTTASSDVHQKNFASWAGSGFCVHACVANIMEASRESRPICSTISNAQFVTNPDLICLTADALNCNRNDLVAAVVSAVVSTLVSFILFKPLRLAIKYCLIHTGKGGSCHVKSLAAPVEALSYIIILCVCVCWLVMAATLVIVVSPWTVGTQFLNAIVPIITSLLSALALDVVWLVAEFVFCGKYVLYGASGISKKPRRTMSQAELYMDSVKDDVKKILPSPIAKVLVPKPHQEDSQIASAAGEVKSEPPQGQQQVSVPLQETNSFVVPKQCIFR